MNRFFCSLLVFAFCAVSNTNAKVQEEDLQIGNYLYRPVGTPDPSKPVVRLEITQFALPNANFPIIERTINSLVKVFGRNNFEAKVFAGTKVDLATTDLVLSSAGTYLRTLGNSAHRLATVVSNKFPDPNQSEGSLFVTLKHRNDINNFGDMKGKIAVGTGSNAFAGMHVALGEIAARGEDPDSFFSKILIGGRNMPDELRLLREGKTDIAILRTCLLEEMAEKNKNSVADIKPIAAKQQPSDFKCVSSTDLYPNWTIFVTPKAPPEVAQKAMEALLSIPPDKNGLRWGIATDFSSTDALFKRLKKGPYEYLAHWSWKNFLVTYWNWFLFAFLLVSALASYSIFISVLLRNKAKDLEAALEKQILSEKEAKSATERLNWLQKNGVIGQMSFIIAHELRQPLSTIIGYCQGIQRLLENIPGKDNEKALVGIERIRKQAEKAEQIVQKVRGYAKQKNDSRVKVNVIEIINKVIETVLNSMTSKPAVVFLPSFPEAFVNADPLELELCFVNLIRNAAQASGQSRNPEIEISISKLLDNKVKINISDNGPFINDETFSTFLNPQPSKKENGLGLGLVITKTIIQNLGGNLEFTRNAPSGITVSLYLNLV